MPNNLPSAENQVEQYGELTLSHYDRIQEIDNVAAINNTLLVIGTLKSFRYPVIGIWDSRILRCVDELIFRHADYDVAFYDICTAHSTIAVLFRNRIIYDPNGAIGCPYHLRVWGVTNGLIHFDSQLVETEVTDLQYSDGGTVLAAIVNGSKIRVWRFQPQAQFYDIETGWDEITEIGIAGEEYIYIADRRVHHEEYGVEKFWAKVIDSKRVIVWDLLLRTFKTEYPRRSEAKEFARGARVFHDAADVELTTFVGAETGAMIGAYPSTMNWTRLGGRENRWIGAIKTSSLVASPSGIRIVSLRAGEAET